ncbi:MAG: flagellar hook-length control protein FliK [Maricaulaceae bacterium]
MGASSVALGATLIPNFLQGEGLVPAQPLEPARFEALVREFADGDGFSAPPEGGPGADAGGSEAFTPDPQTAPPEGQDFSANPGPGSAQAALLGALERLINAQPPQTAAAIGQPEVTERSITALTTLAERIAGLLEAAPDAPSPSVSVPDGQDIALAGLTPALPPTATPGLTADLSLDDALAAAGVSDPSALEQPFEGLTPTLPPTATPGLTADLSLADALLAPAAQAAAAAESAPTAPPASVEQLANLLDRAATAQTPAERATAIAQAVDQARGVIAGLIQARGPAAAATTPTLEGFDPPPTATPLADPVTLADARLGEPLGASPNAQPPAPGAQSPATPANPLAGLVPNFTDGLGPNDPRATPLADRVSAPGSIASLAEGGEPVAAPLQDLALGGGAAQSQSQSPAQIQSQVASLRESLLAGVATPPIGRSPANGPAQAANTVPEPDGAPAPAPAAAPAQTPAPNAPAQTGLSFAAAQTANPAAPSPTAAAPIAANPNPAPNAALTDPGLIAVETAAEPAPTPATQTQTSVEPATPRSETAFETARASLADAEPRTAALDPATSPANRTQPVNPSTGAAQTNDAGLTANAEGRPTVEARTLAPFAAALAARAAQGRTVFDIRLDPAELGRVEVRLDVGAERSARAQIVVERADVLADFQRQSRDLERALNEAGLEVEENGLEFVLEDSPDNFADQPGQNEPEPAFTAAPSASERTEDPTPAPTLNPNTTRVVVQDGVALLQPIRLNLQA